MSKKYFENMQKFQTKAYGRKLYSLIEIYRICVKALSGIKYMRKKDELVGDKLRERIMLAVTSVNGCAICSYGHTKMALEVGLDKEEIKSFVEGEFPNIPADESKAVVFAQYYADNRGNLEKEIWQALVSEYGEQKAIHILANTRAIMMGNALGIPLSSLKARIKEGKGDARSNIFYELSIFILAIPMFVVSILRALLNNLFRKDFIGKLI